MYARVSTGQVNLDKVGAAQDSPQQETSITQLPGFMGNMTLLDRQTGKGMVIGLWDTEEHLLASVDAHRAGMEQAVQAGVLSTMPTIEIFEVTQKTDLR